MDNLFLIQRTMGTSSSGFLSFFESNIDIPFQIKRVYYIYDVPILSIRGKHAHKSLKQLLWCPHGEIEVILDNGYQKRSFLLDSPQKTLLVLEGYWHEMIWIKESSVLCVASSEYYDEKDYIRDYNEFLKFVKANKYENKF